MESWIIFGNPNSCISRNIFSSKECKFYCRKFDLVVSDKDTAALLARNVRQQIWHQVSRLAQSKSVTLHPQWIPLLELAQINIFKRLRAIISGYSELSSL